MQVTTSITGADEIVRKLKLMPERIGRNAMRRSLRKGANVIRDIARANAKALDDPITKYNQIWKNIVVQGGGRRREKTEGGPLMRVGVLGGARDYSAYGEIQARGKGNPGGDTWYWRLVEFGTSEFSAKPFMRPAISAGADKAFNVVIASMQKEMDKELRKLGAK